MGDFVDLINELNFMVILLIEFVMGFDDPNCLTHGGSIFGELGILISFEVRGR